jgi:hypothetical protein
MVLNLGHGYLAWAPAQQRLVPGYTWIAYPYELDHAFDRLADELSVVADEDDMIIGRDGFAEYTGTGWKTTDGFTLRAGTGYQPDCAERPADHHRRHRHKQYL